MNDLQTFVSGLHASSKVLVYGKAHIQGREVDAVLVRNLYGQNIVWGMFSVDNKKGKFVGKLANNANTEGVVFKFPDTMSVTWTETYDKVEKQKEDAVWAQWMKDLHTVPPTHH